MAYVTVQIDLGEIDTADLVREVASRQRAAAADPGTPEHTALQNMYIALSQRDEQRALELLRTYLCDCLGRVLP